MSEQLTEWYELVVFTVSIEIYETVAAGRKTDLSLKCLRIHYELCS